MKPSIIIPVHDNLLLTAACVDALEACPDCDGAEIIIADDASSDGTARWARGAGLKLVRSEVNGGFASACNMGAAEASGDALVFLNNDALPRPGWLASLLACAAETGAGIAGGRLVFPDGTIQHAGITFRADGTPSNFLRGQPYADEPFVIRRRAFQAVTGACMLVRRALFRKLGGFDESFRNGYEDADLCLRAGSFGESVVYEPACLAVHQEARSIGRSRRGDGRLSRFLSRWAGRVKADDAELRREFFARLTGAPQSYCTVVAGGGSWRNLDRCLAMLSDAAVESAPAHRIMVADYGAPGGADALRNLGTAMGLDIGVLPCEERDTPRGIIARAAAAARCEFTSVISPSTVVPPGWAHRLAMHLSRGRSAIVGPVYGGLKGEQGFDPSELRPGSRNVTLAEISSALFTARRGSSSLAGSLLPHCVMMRTTGGSAPASCFPAAVARDTLVYTEGRI